MFRFDQLFELDDQKKLVRKVVKIEKRVPWIEKYRPKKLANIVNQEDVVRTFQKVVETGNLPHTLLYGDPGTGKTSAILALAMELFGPKIIKERVIELNASDERGINIVRKKIQTFAKLAIGSVDVESQKRYPCPPFKIIILDEADAMTTEAQWALRKTLEDYSHITRFCFICNYINKIIEPINSRCVKFRFKPLNKKNIYLKLQDISITENIKIKKNVFVQISKLCNGDMRKAIMLLQNLKYISDSGTSKLTIKSINEMNGIMNNTLLKKINNVCIVDKTKTGEKVVELANKLMSMGYPMTNVLSQIFELIVGSEELTDEMKSRISFHFAKTEQRLIKGGDEYLQLLSALMCIKGCAIEMPIIQCL